MSEENFEGSQDDQKVKKSFSVKTDIETKKGHQEDDVTVSFET